MKKEFEIEIPTIPSFIACKIAGESKAVGLAEFTDKEIIKIIEEWGDKLQEAAKKKRNEKYRNP